MRRLDKIVALVEAALASGLGSAAAVSVGDAGVEVFRCVRGHTRRLPDLGAPIDDSTPFDVASLTKPMSTVALAMTLVGDGKLDLDAPIRRWLPDAASTGSVRHLLGHCAGYAAHVELFRWLRGARPADPYAALLARAIREPCDPPGVTAIYSDLGFLALGAVVERAANQPLHVAFERAIAGPLGLSARFAPVTAQAIAASGTTPLVAGAVATEIDERGVVAGVVHDENAYYGGGVCGHAGRFASIDDLSKFAAAIVAAANGVSRAGLVPDVVTHFLSDAPVPGAAWRLGWDTPSQTPGVSQAGDRWPREHAVGHTGFTGTSLWLDLPNRRWCALLTNRVHPTRFGTTADQMKTLRRAVNDAVVDELDR